MFLKNWFIQGQYPMVRDTRMFPIFTIMNNLSIKSHEYRERLYTTCRCKVCHEWIIEIVAITIHQSTRSLLLFSHAVQSPSPTEVESTRLLAWTDVATLRSGLSGRIAKGRPRERISAKGISSKWAVEPVEERVVGRRGSKKKNEGHVLIRLAPISLGS